MVKLALFIILPFSMYACKLMKDDTDNCGVYLEFRYDYNMEFADAFSPQVSNVQVMVFDADDHYLFSRSAQRQELIDEKRMFFREDIDFGQYRIFAVGGLSGSFKITDATGNQPTEGITQLQDIRVSLNRTTDSVSEEFQDIWVAPVTTIQYNANLSVWPVRFIKNTNRFHLLLTHAGEHREPPTTDVPYTFEIETPEGAVYGYDNFPLAKATLTFLPHYLAWGEQAEDIAVGRINTMRLLDEDGYDYRLRIRNTKTNETVWEYDLLQLIGLLKQNDSQTSEMPLQEYLDRENEWNMVIVFKEEGGETLGEGAFIGLKIIINGWVIWENDIEV